MATPGPDPADVTDVVVELVVEGGAGAADLAAADLWAAGATAVEERGGAAVTLVASFPTPEAARVVAAEVGGRAVEITDTSWRDRWRDFAGPVAVEPGLVVAPGWREVAPDPGASGLVVRIDPGGCFGSGTHPSTRLVLRLLMERSRARGLRGSRVLDVGCGSGILSVTAACLGARVTAVDVEEEAVARTAANAVANGVGALVEASTRAVGSSGGGFDLALVNVTAGVHARLGAATAAAVRPGGALLLAGLLPGQWRHVAGAYPGTTVTARPGLEGWEGVVLAREGAGRPSGGAG